MLGGCARRMEGPILSVEQGSFYHEGHDSLTGQYAGHLGDRAARRESCKVFDRFSWEKLKKSGIEGLGVGCFVLARQPAWRSGRKKEGKMKI